MQTVIQDILPTKKICSYSIKQL